MKRPRRKATDAPAAPTSASTPSSQRPHSTASRISTDDLDHEFQIQIQSAFKTSDDSTMAVNSEAQSQHMFETITRIGGEVCRMRSEVDELLEQNATLLNAFEKLWEMLDEKGTVNMDDFDLACEVLESPMKNLKPQAIKKSYN